MEKTEELKNVLRDLYEISGFRISVYNQEMREVAAYPEKMGGFCQILQKNQYALECCVKSDQNAFSEVRKTGRVMLYRCPFGLYEAVAPLFSFGVLSGYLMMGQAVDTFPGSRDGITRQSIGYVEEDNREQLIKEIEEIPSTTREKILSCIRIMDICAQYITLSNRFTLKKEDLAQETCRYLLEHLHEKITMEQICREFFCSRTTLAQAFKRRYQCGVGQYLIRLRMEKAQQLLNSSERSISEIAVLCGFSDQNYFSRMFCKAIGVSPTEYRKRKMTGDHKEE